MYKIIKNMHLSIEEIRNTISDPETRFTIYCLAKYALENPVGDFNSPRRGLCQAIEVATMMVTHGEWSYHFGPGGGSWINVIESEFPDLFYSMLANGGSPTATLGGWWWVAEADQSDKIIRVKILDELINTYQVLYGFS